MSGTVSRTWRPIFFGLCFFDDVDNRFREAPKVCRRSPVDTITIYRVSIKSLNTLIFRKRFKILKNRKIRIQSFQGATLLRGLGMLPSQGGAPGGAPLIILNGTLPIIVYHLKGHKKRKL